MDGLADLIDPCPDIHDLFVYYNDRYFEGQLGCCAVNWSSKRMTLCAGICRYSKYQGCEIKLSEPLLKFRPVSDLKNTLLHEMIHAYLFLTNGDKDHDDHGPRFQNYMKKINQCDQPDFQRPETGYQITVYHSFTDEVETYRVHHWRCTKCGNLIKRAMNRTPSTSDCRTRRKDCLDPKCDWHMHLTHCGGSYEKIQEPAGYIDKRKQLKIKEEDMKDVTQLADEKETSLLNAHHKRMSSTTIIGPVNKGIKGESHVKINSLDKYFPLFKKTVEKPLIVESRLKEGDKDVEVSEACTGVPFADQGVLVHSSKKLTSIFLTKEEYDKNVLASAKAGNQVNKLKRARDDNEGLGKRRYNGSVGTDSTSRAKNPVVIIAWANWCSYDDDEEEDPEPLIRKRTYRRVQEGEEKPVIGKGIASQMPTEGEVVGICDFVNTNDRENAHPRISSNRGFAPQCRQEVRTLDGKEIGSEKGSAGKVVLILKDDEEEDLEPFTSERTYRRFKEVVEIT